MSCKPNGACEISRSSHDFDALKTHLAKVTLHHGPRINGRLLHLLKSRREPIATREELGSTHCTHPSVEKNLSTARLEAIERLGGNLVEAEHLAEMVGWSKVSGARGEGKRSSDDDSHGHFV